VGHGHLAHAVEGHITNEWTNHVARDGRTCHPACDSYHRYPEDVDWLSRLGVKAYRMGIEWSRLQAGPFAPLNQAELDRYLDQLERLKVAGIEPMVVLHHFSNPMWIIEKGGWTNHTTVDAFVDYVTKLAAALHGRVRLWNTFNEPDTYASCSYLIGEFPPEQKWRLFAYRRVILNMAQAHLKACQIVRQGGAKTGSVEVDFPKTGLRLRPTTIGHRGIAASPPPATRFSTTLSCAASWVAAGGKPPPFSASIIMAGFATSTPDP